MRLDVQQVVTLSYHAAASILTGEVGQELLSHNEAFAKVHEVEFSRVGKVHGGKVADSVSPFFRRLRTEGVVLVRPLLGSLSLVNNAKDSHPWGILTDGDRGIELWRPTWKARLAGYGDERPYKVSYVGDRIARWSVPPPPKMADAKVRLRNAIAAAREALDPVKEAETVALIERCEILLDRGVASFGQTAFMWPTTVRTDDSAVIAVAIKAANFASSLTNHRVLRGEKLDELWLASLGAFEAANATQAFEMAA